MTKVLTNFSIGATAIAQGSLNYWPFGSGTGTNVTLTESVAQTIIRAPGVVSNLFTQVSANTLSGDFTFRFRKNTANGNSVIVYSAGQTGYKEDTVNTDAVAAGDLAGYSVATAIGSGNGTMGGIMGCTFEATIDTVNYIGGTRPSTRTFSAASTVSPIGYGGGIDAAVAEQNITMESMTSATYTTKNLYGYCTSNARTTDTTLTSRNNFANGGLIVTWSSGQTGAKEDVSNVDLVDEADSINLAITTGTGSGNFILSIAMANIISKQNAYQVHSTGGFNQGVGLTWYRALNGSLFSVTTEAQQQAPIQERTIFSNMNVYVSANTNTGDSVVRFRKNGNDGNLSITFSSGQTGSKYDTSDTDECVAGDLVNTACTSGATGTNINFTWVSILAEVQNPFVWYAALV